MNEDPLKCLAGILRVDQDTLAHMDEMMAKRFGKSGVVASVCLENHRRIESVLKELKISDVHAVTIYRALIKKVQEDDESLARAFGIRAGTDPESYRILTEKADELSMVGEGFFLKWSKAEELLRMNPPKNIMSFFGAGDIKDLLAKEDIRKVFSALRFAEDRDWLNNVFFAPYSELTPDDFERRKIDLLVLGNNWIRLAEKFMEKKYHNVSHLKELGLIFVLPQDIKTPGESLRLFTLILHYLHEITFYSDMFYEHAEHPQDPLWFSETFSNFLTASLRGDVLDKRLPDSRKLNWMIVQRYLAKDDENDWRLFEPHINPEAIHWSKAEENIAHINEKFPGLDLSFWHDLGWVGNHFPTESGANILVSFNLIDTVMALVKEKEMIKYLYHHQEALWNKIFASYVGKEETRRMVIKNFSKGYVTL
ncbi:MAG: hypothetical protein HYY55_01430 [Candidatus Niyogibacteria bacterium]|nr:MAG: hypothetical protein HYY55_01430 [Candidatus Niyogibacteria bacterium]